MENRHVKALASAIDRAHKAFLRQQQAAKNAVGGEKRRQQLQASADKAEAFWKDLQGAGDLFDKLLQSGTPELAAPVLGADHPFATGQYASDNGPVVMFAADAESRLSRVPGFTAEQCEIALQVPGLQTVVRKAIERRQRALSKAGA